MIVISARGVLPVLTNKLVRNVYLAGICYLVSVLGATNLSLAAHFVQARAVISALMAHTRVETPVYPAAITLAAQITCAPYMGAPNAIRGIF